MIPFFPVLEHGPDVINALGQFLAAELNAFHLQLLPLLDGFGELRVLGFQQLVVGDQFLLGDDAAVYALEGSIFATGATVQWLREIRTLRWVAERYNRYLIPLHASYAMQMQSNAFEKNRREPVWFSFN